MYDFLVVGGGPAGLLAGAQLARAGLSGAIVERELLGGQLVGISTALPVAGIEATTGAGLAAALAADLMDAGAAVVFGDARRVLRRADHWTVAIDSDDLEARAVVVATGTSRESLGLSEERFLGSGVFSCGACDGPLYRGERVAVVGDADLALWEAAELAPYASEVLVLVRLPAFDPPSGDADALRRLPNVRVETEAAVQGVHGGSRLEAITYRQRGRDVNVDVRGLVPARTVPNVVPVLDACTERVSVRAALEQTTDPARGLFAIGDVDHHAPSFERAVGEADRMASLLVAYLSASG